MFSACEQKIFGLLGALSHKTGISLYFFFFKFVYFLRAVYTQRQEPRHQEACALLTGPARRPSPSLLRSSVGLLLCNVLSHLSRRLTTYELLSSSYPPLSVTSVNVVETQVRIPVLSLAWGRLGGFLNPASSLTFSTVTECGHTIVSGPLRVLSLT